MQGKDATEAFDPIHPPDTLDKYLDKSKHLGTVDLSTVAHVEEAEDPEEADRQQRIKDKPLITQCYNLMDFEAVAKKVMKRGAWGYYSSAADDEIVRIVVSRRLPSELTFGAYLRRLFTGWARFTNDNHRHSEKTTRPITGYGLGPRFWLT